METGTGMTRKEPRAMPRSMPRALGLDPEDEYFQQQQTESSSSALEIVEECNLYLISRR